MAGSRSKITVSDCIQMIQFPVIIPLPGLELGPPYRSIMTIMNKTDCSITGGSAAGGCLLVGAGQLPDPTQMPALSLLLTEYHPNIFSYSITFSNPFLDSYPHATAHGDDHAFTDCHSDPSGANSDY